MLNSEDSIVGPPSGVCWSNPWHEILHDWNADTTHLGDRLRCVIIGSWRATLRTFHPIDGQNEHENGNCVRKQWAGNQTHWSQGLRNLRGGSDGTTGKTLPWATLRCGSNQCLSLYHLQWVNSRLLHLCLRPKTGPPLACRLDLDLGLSPLKRPVPSLKSPSAKPKAP